MEKARRESDQLEHERMREAASIRRDAAIRDELYGKQASLRAAMADLQKLQTDKDELLARQQDAATAFHQLQEEKAAIERKASSMHEEFKAREKTYMDNYELLQNTLAEKEARINAFSGQGEEAVAILQRLQQEKEQLLDEGNALLERYQKDKAKHEACEVQLRQVTNRLERMNNDSWIREQELKSKILELHGQLASVQLSNKDTVEQPAAYLVPYKHGAAAPTRSSLPAFPRSFAFEEEKSSVSTIDVIEVGGADDYSIASSIFNESKKYGDAFSLN